LDLAKERGAKTTSLFSTVLGKDPRSRGNFDGSRSFGLLRNCEYPSDSSLFSDIISISKCNFSLQSQYEGKINEFKETHKRLHELKTQLEKKPVTVLAEDIRHIDKDIDSLSKKVDHIKKRVGSAIEP
jgi:tetrahydromethanopterin S-methyltransferase subunit G